MQQFTFSPNPGITIWAANKFWKLIKAYFYTTVCVCVYIVIILVYVIFFEYGVEALEIYTILN